MARHVRAMDPSVLYWDLVPVPMPTPTLYDYDTMAGFVYKVLEGVDMTTKLCLSSNVMLSGLVRRQEEIRLLYLLPLSELSKQRERSTLFSVPGSVRPGISFNSDVSVRSLFHKHQIHSKIGLASDFRWLVYGMGTCGDMKEFVQDDGRF